MQFLAPFPALPGNYKGLQTLLDQWVKGLSQATQPCSHLLWSAVLGRGQAEQRKPESTGRPQLLSLSGPQFPCLENDYYF